MAKPVIAQLSKAPIPGRVKTRMQPHLTQEQSVALHRWLTEKNVHEFSGSADWSFELWIDSADDFFAQIQSAYALNLRMQTQGDLGERLNVISSAHHAKPLLLIGSDCPFLNTTHANMMFDHLQQEHRHAAMIPANDGGYVALAVKDHYPELFMGVDWGSDTVAEHTLANARRAGLTLMSLPPLSDIDRPQDLALLDDFKSTGFSVSKPSYPLYKIV